MLDKKAIDLVKWIKEKSKVILIGDNWNLTVLVVLVSCIITLLSFYQLLIFGNYCPDAVVEGWYYYTNGNWALACGRWLTRYIINLHGSIVIPLFEIIIYMLCICFCIILICKMWKITNKYSIIAITMIMTITPTLIEQATYIHVYATWGLSTAFSVSMVYVLWYEKKSWKNIILGAVLMAMALGLYQSCVGTIAVLVIQYIIVLVVRQEYDVYNKIKTNVFSSMESGILGGIIYFVILKIELYRWHVGVAGRVQDASIVKIFTNLKESIVTIYISFYQYFFESVFRRKYFWMILFIVLVISIIKFEIKLLESKKIISAILTIVLITMIPLGAGIIRILIPYNELTNLMKYQFVFIVPFIFALIDKTYMMRYLSIFVTTILCFTYVFSANASFACFHISYEHIKFETQTILQRIVELDDYQTDDVIVFAGFIDDDYLRSNIYLYRYAIGLTENVAFWEDANGLDMGRRNFLMDFYGIDAGSIDSKEYMEMIKSDEFKEMGVYPDNNSIKKISNMIVVKLSDTPPEY